MEFPTISQVNSLFHKAPTRGLVEVVEVRVHNRDTMFSSKTPRAENDSICIGNIFGRDGEMYTFSI